MVGLFAGVVARGKVSGLQHKLLSGQDGVKKQVLSFAKGDEVLKQADPETDLHLIDPAAEQ